MFLLNKTKFYRFRHSVWTNADGDERERRRRATAKVHNFQPTALEQSCADQQDSKVKLFGPMSRRESACPAGREQFSLPVVWGSPARWRVQGRSDGIFRRNCSQSPQAEGKQFRQTRRNHTGSRLRTSSRTWASACKCKWTTPKTTSHMESGLKFEPVVTACGPGGVSEIMPSLFFT